MPARLFGSPVMSGFQEIHCNLKSEGSFINRYFLFRSDVTANTWAYFTSRFRGEPQELQREREREREQFRHRPQSLWPLRYLHQNRFLNLSFLLRDLISTAIISCESLPVFIWLSFFIAFLLLSWLSMWVKSLSFSV